MPRWDFLLTAQTLESWPGRGPLVARLGALIGGEIRRGRLRPGDRLPGTRSLARTLGINRNTVVAAYQELEAEGWVDPRPAGGTFVSERLPDLAPDRFSERSAPGLPERPGFEFSSEFSALGAVVGAHEASSIRFALFGGIPDLRLLPVAELGRAYRRALRAPGRRELDYAQPFGLLRLRQAVAEFLNARRGLAVAADNVLITRGSQMALDLVSRLLVRPGNRVAVEAAGYQPAWAALRVAGARLVRLPIDEAGLDVEQLRAALRGGLRAVYVTPHHQYPTTAVLSAARRMELLTLAAQSGLVIIEDDYDHEFHYDGRPLMPLASADASGNVVYIGTLSKILAPGLRLGFVVAPAALIRALAELRAVVDRQGDQVTERAVAELLEDGILLRHARRMRRAYRGRRDALAEALRREFGDRLDFSVPAGGMALWARLVRGDARGWAERAQKRGVSFASGDVYIGPDAPPADFRHYRRFLRLGFARYDETELATAVRLMGAAL
jgi:GntR family transcriptional regulator / MocR family aminotransferase